MTDERDGKQLDVSGVCCPVPLIHLANAIQGMQAGETLLITGNDPVFETTVRDYCKANGHAVIDVQKGENRQVSIRISVRG